MYIVYSGAQRKRDIFHRLFVVMSTKEPRENDVKIKLKSIKVSLKHQNGRRKKNVSRAHRRRVTGSIQQTIIQFEDGFVFFSFSPSNTFIFFLLPFYRCLLFTTLVYSFDFLLWFYFPHICVVVDYKMHESSNIENNER